MLAFDAAVDCGRFEEAARVASEPTLVAEILSPSTADFDQHEKLEEYRTVPSLRHILIIDPDQPRLRLHSRGADGHWESAPHAGLELYEGLTFRPLPRLVLPIETSREA
jgi:Uma2 family endonuclease